MVHPTVSLRGENKFLLWLPLVVLIVPQGTITRSFIPEIIFAVFLLITMLLVFFHATLKGQISIPSSKINMPLLILIAYFLFLNPLLSVLYGNDVLRILLTVLPFVLLVVYYLISVQGLGVIQTRRLVMAFGISGAIVSMLVIWNYFLGDTSASDMRSTNIEGSRTLTLPLIPMAGVLFLSFTLTTRHRRYMAIFAVLAVICIIAVIMTVTRAMLLAYGVGVAVVLWLLITGHSNRRQRRHVFRVLSYFATVVFLLGMPFITPWLSRINLESEGDVATILGRFDEYAAFIDGFFHSPIFGQGLGHLFIYPSIFDMTLSESGITVCHSHFFFLIGTTGLVGALLYYAVIAVGIKLHWQESKKIPADDDSRGYLVGMLGAAVAGLLFTLFSTTFTTLSYNLFLAIFLHTSRLKWCAR